MHMTATSLALMVALAAPGVAQNRQDQAKKTQTETVWELTIKGIGGWSAAVQAKRAREALAKVSGVASVVVDTTARAVIRTGKNAKLPSKGIAKALKKLRLSTITIESRKMPVAAATYEVTVKGMSWQSSCQNVRAAFEKLSGVIAAYPHGDTGIAVVKVKKEDGIDKKAVEKALAGEKSLKVTAFKKQGKAAATRAN